MATFNPVSGGDGIIEYDGGTWLLVHDSPVGTTTTAGATDNLYCDYYGGVSGWYLSRICLPFDTSSIPAGATITSATLQIWINTKNNGDGAANIALVQTTQASSSALAIGDYDSFGTTEATDARLLQANITTGQYNTMTLNATGRGFITKGGVTFLGLRTAYDIDNSATSSNPNGIVIQSTTGTNPPILTVNYSTSTGGSKGFMTTKTGFWG